MFQHLHKRIPMRNSINHAKYHRDVECCKLSVHKIFISKIFCFDRVWKKLCKIFCETILCRLNQSRLCDTFTIVTNCGLVAVNLNQCWLVIYSPFSNKPHGSLNQSTLTLVEEIGFEMSSAKYRPSFNLQCVNTLWSNDAIWRHGPTSPIGLLPDT